MTPKNLAPILIVLVNKCMAALCANFFGFVYIDKNLFQKVYKYNVTFTFFKYLLTNNDKIGHLSSVSTRYM